MHKEKDERDNLIKKYDNFSLENKFNKKEFENIIIDVIKSKIDKEENNIKRDSEILIDIESPLFEIISKTKGLENNYAIYISQKNIDKNKLKDDYKIYLDNLNRINIKYLSIYYIFYDKNKINYFKELNIDANKIKRITLIKEDCKEEENSKNKKFYEFLLKFEKLEFKLQ